MIKSIILNKFNERVHEFSHWNWRKYNINSVIWIISLEFTKMSLSLFLKDRINIFKMFDLIIICLVRFNIWICEFISLMPNTSKTICQPDLVDNLAFCLCTVVPLGDTLPILRRIRHIGVFDCCSALAVKSPKPTKWLWTAREDSGYLLGRIN